MQNMKSMYSYRFTNLFLETFQQENIHTVFGSSFSFPFLQNKQGLTFQQLTHEQSIVHAADGYARATGKTGIAFITRNFGVTNAITGIATAHIDSIPLLVFIQKEHYSSDYLDVESITKDISKQFLTIQGIEHIPSIIKNSHQLSNHGRPGVVIVELSSDLLQEKCIDQPFSPDLELVNRKPSSLPYEQIEKVIHAIKHAQKPLLLIGGGVVSSGASDILQTFIRLTKIPFASTLMGLGAINVGHDLHLGMVGMHGTFAANRAVHRCDLLISLGVRFSDRITGKTKGFSPHSKKVQVDIDPVEINKNILIDLPIIGDVKAVLAELNTHLAEYSTSHWEKKVINWRKTSPRFSHSTSLIKPYDIIQQISEHTPSNIKVSTDVGQHQMWTALHFPFSSPHQFLTSGGFGTMGYGLPAAIGAAVSNENQPVLLVTGDGSFQMNIQELYHVAKHRLNIKIVILRNGYLGMVRQWQQLFYRNKYSQVKISSPNFVSLAESYGISGYQAKNKEQATDIISKAFSNNEPAILDFVIDEEQNVYPIVPPGGNNTDALLSHDSK